MICAVTLRVGSRIGLNVGVPVGAQAVTGAFQKGAGHTLAAPAGRIDQKA